MSWFPEEERAIPTLPELNASPHVEEQLLARFRCHHQARSLLRRRAYRAALALAAGVAILMVWLRQTTTHSSSFAEFHPLPGSVLTTQMMESGQIVRVELTPAALAQLGIALPAEPVEAELLLGQDGLARAIRFVQ